MVGDVAFLNGDWVPSASLSVPVTDAGFVLGVTVAEQLRTFGGKLFRLERHLDRLFHSLEIVGVAPPYSRDEFHEIATQLASRNHARMAPGDDLGLSMFVTPRPYATFHPGGGHPLVAMHTYPLPFRLWFRQYEVGQHLIVTETRQVPANCWPPELKCRSRMHYYLADRAARRIDASARALLLDQDGFVTEASTANLIYWHAEQGLVSPPEEKILPGVSVATLAELARNLGMPFSHRPVRVEDVETAHEAFLTSTSPCILPVTRCNGRPIGNGRPGPVFQRLLEAWSQHVGVDIVVQARQFAEAR